MFNLMKCELYKLSHSTGFMIMIVLSALCGIIAAVFFAFAEVIGSGMNLSGYEAYYGMFTDLRTFLLIFIGVFSGIFIGEDYACRAYQAALALGNSRFKVLLNKTVVYMLGIVGMIVVWQFFVVAIVTLINGFGVTLSFGIIGHMIRSLMMFSLHLCACSMLCVLTSVAIKSKGTIILVNFLLLILVDGLFQGLSMVYEKGFDIYSKTPFIQSLLFSVPKVSVYDMVVSIGIGMAVMMILFSMGLMIFQRSELR